MKSFIATKLRPFIRGLGHDEAAWLRLSGELIGIIYIAFVAETAISTGAFFILFPELAALSHDVLTRPQGPWARSPVLLAITPVATAVIGIIFTNLLPYGFVSVLAIVGSAIVVLPLMRSPVAPAISAGLLPLVIGVKSWWYPPGILFGTVLLAVLSELLKKSRAHPPVSATEEDVTLDILETAPSGLSWVLALLLFVIVAVVAVELTGLRFILFPPLVVIGYEMLGHPGSCPWAQRPLLLPVACLLTGACGFASLQLLGLSAPAAALAMASGIVILKLFDLHIPPALAIALLPFVMDHPTWIYPFSVFFGTLLMSVWFLSYQHLIGKRRILDDPSISA